MIPVLSANLDTVPVQFAHLSEDSFDGCLGKIFVEQFANVLVHRWTLHLRLLTSLRRVAVEVRVLNHCRVSAVEMQRGLLTHHHLLIHHHIHTGAQQFSSYTYR